MCFLSVFLRGLPVSAFAALVHGSRRVRDNALACVAMQPDVGGDVLHLAAVWGNDWAKDLTIKHPNVMEETLEAIAQGVGPVAANARRELDRRRADARRELERRREWGSTWSDRARVPRGVIVGVGGRVDLVGLARPPLVFSPLFLSKMRLPFVLSSSCFKFREN